MQRPGEGGSGAGRGKGRGRARTPAVNTTVGKASSLPPPSEPRPGDRQPASPMQTVPGPMLPGPALPVQSLPGLALPGLTLLSSDLPGPTLPGPVFSPPAQTSADKLVPGFKAVKVSGPAAGIGSEPAKSAWSTAKQGLPMEKKAAASGASGAGRESGRPSGAERRPTEGRAAASGASGAGRAGPAVRGVPARPVGAEPRPVERPEEGGSWGRPILLRANFVRLVLRGDVRVWHYDVRVSSARRNAEVKNKGALREVVDLWVAGHMRPRNQLLYVAYDGRNSVYTNKILPIQPMERFSVLDSVGREFYLVAKAADPGEIDLSEALDYFARTPHPLYPAKHIQALDIIIRESALHDGFFSIGRHLFFDRLRSSGRSPLSPYFELWNGAFQSVRPTWKCLMLQVDMIVRVFHTEQHMLDLQKQMERENRKRWVDNMSRHIQGVKFTGHKFGYTAFRLGPSANQHRFEVGGKMYTVAQYYQEKIGITLEYPNLPCVQAKPKEKNCFIPMELCKIRANQQVDNLSEFLKGQLLNEQTMGAERRMTKIEDIIRKLKFDENKVLKAFNIHIEAQMMEAIEGRVLDPPSVEYKNGMQKKVVDGKWDARGAQLYATRPIQTVLVYSLAYERTFEEKAKALVKELSSVARSMGLSIPSQAKDIQGLNDQPVDIEKEMDYIKGSQHKLPLLVIFVLPQQRRNDLYDTIKMFGDSKLGIHTQCLKENNAWGPRAPNRTTLFNLCLKINGKLGGVNSVVANTLELFAFKRRVMVMGADVNHPGANRAKPSVTAVTGSYDRYACRYASRISAQTGGTETIMDLERMTKELLVHFCLHNKELYPEMLLYFRDGVSEGQFEKMLSFELLCLRRACALIDPNYRPGITVVVVRKRHRTKFQPMEPKEGSGQGGNVPPGTVEDRATVDPHRFEYYLCSHHAIKGTSKSGLYTVLYDDNGFSMDLMEQLSFHLCHLYARCTHAVSYPAPTYYADLCAERGRRYLECPGSDGRRKQLVIHSDISGMYFL